MNRIIIYLLVLVLIGCKSAQPKIQPVKKGKVATKQVYKPKSNPVVTIEKNETVNQSKSETLEATSKIKVTTEIVLAYIDNFKQVAKDNMTKNGIPASITLAQGILESGAGTGTLSINANNHFGIKCHKEWTGPSVKHDDDAAQECFRKYELAEESYRDHSYFLTSRPRYANLFKLEKSDYKGWAKGLKNAGYATDVKYPDKLIGLIERYQLQQYDAEVLGTVYTPKTPEIKEIVSERRSVLNVNNHVVEKGDTLYSLSKKFNITVEELKKINNLLDTTLSLGQIILIK